MTTTVDVPYWLSQNSWGAGWGDGGFVKFERSQDYSIYGVCGIYRYVEWVDVQA